MEQENRRKERKLTFQRGPFEFYYIAYYTASPGDEFWSFIQLKSDSFLEIEGFPRKQFNELIKKHGAEAMAAAYGTARKKMRVHSSPISTV